MAPSVAPLHFPRTQLAALRSSHGTLSEVLVEEAGKSPDIYFERPFHLPFAWSALPPPRAQGSLTPVHPPSPFSHPPPLPPNDTADGLRADIKALQEQLAQRLREVDALAEEQQRLSRAGRATEDQVREVRHELVRVNAAAREAAQQAADAQAAVSGSSLGPGGGIGESVLVAHLSEQVGALAARLTAAEQRAATAEDAAANATLAAQRAKQEASELRRAFEAHQDSSARRLTEVESRAAALESLVDARVSALARDASARAQQAVDTARDLHAQAGSALATALAAMHAGLDRAAAESARALEEAGEAHTHVADLRARTGEAATALAADVKMLAGELMARQQEISDVSSRVSAAEDALADVRAGLREVAGRAEDVADAHAQELARAGAAAAKASAQAAEALQRAEHVERSSSSEARSLSARVGAVESSLPPVAVSTEGVRRLEETARAHTARLDALAAAVQAFANVLAASGRGLGAGAASPLGSSSSSSSFSASSSSFAAAPAPPPLSPHGLSSSSAAARFLATSPGGPSYRPSSSPSSYRGRIGGSSGFGLGTGGLGSGVGVGGGGGYGGWDLGSPLSSLAALSARAQAGVLTPPRQGGESGAQVGEST
jgi:hypothetical protein